MRTFAHAFSKMQTTRKAYHLFNLSSSISSAEIAQLVEHNLAKVGVASSSLVFRSQGRSNGGIGRHEGLKILWPVMAVRVQVPLRVQRIPCKSLICRAFYFIAISKIPLSLKYTLFICH